MEGLRHGKLAGVPVRILPLVRVIASKQAAGRDKDIVVLPVLKRTLRLAQRLNKRAGKTRQATSKKKK